MIYSRWRPDTGGYDYFETPERFALADDLPTPSLVGDNPIGLSSLVCGRKIPNGARHVGSGRFARGVIAPVDRSGLSGVGGLGAIPGWASLVASVGLVAVLAYSWWAEPKA